MNQKPSEAGWFYHAPVKREAKEQVLVPAPSQIPGLGEIEPLCPDVPKEMLFKETDTKYVRMAKMGGRKDLLTIKPNSETKKAAVPYPRSDWFYLEDNACEDKEKEQQQWQFLLPEYMVHQSYGETTVDGQGEGLVEPDGVNTVPMRRAPYATDDKMGQFNQDGQRMTDKTVRLPETKRQGYGVRNGKPAPKGPQGTVPERAKPMSSQVQGDCPRLRYQPLPQEREEPTNMGKLLSNTYEREWQDRLTKWHDKQDQSQEKQQAIAKKDGAMRSEYNATYSNHAKSGTGRKPASERGGSGDHNQRSKVSSTRKPEEEKKEPFKLSKFKNVPARLNSHQSPEILAAIGN